MLKLSLKEAERKRQLVEPVEGDNMPVRKVKGGYRWGKSGKIYKTKKEAEKQGRAIYASGYKNGTKKRPKTKKSRR